MGGVELNGEWRGRKETGRTFMTVIPDLTMGTFQEVIEKFVHPVSIIWTDGHSSYCFLDTDARYEHKTVIHRRGEFVKLREDGVRISSNAIEGGFSRTKRLLRNYHAKPSTKKGYSPYLAEFMWRTRFLKLKIT